MSDWPTVGRKEPINLCPHHMDQPVGEYVAANNITAGAAAAWPAANRAIYTPFIVDRPQTALQIAMFNGVPSGEVDAGIYSYPGSGTSATRLVSIGKTAMSGEAKLQLFNIADTALVPGYYFLAFVCSTTATATFRRFNLNTGSVVVMGVQQQGLAEPVLPTTATLAKPEAGTVPVMNLVTEATF